MVRHASDRVVNDILGATKVFLITVICVYFAIQIIEALPGVDLPISTSGSWFIGLVVGLLAVYINYVKKRAKSYMS